MPKVGFPLTIDGDASLSLSRIRTFERQLGLRGVMQPAWALKPGNMRYRLQQSSFWGGHPAVCGASGAIPHFTRSSRLDVKHIRRTDHVLPGVVATSIRQDAHPMPNQTQPSTRQASNGSARGPSPPSVGQKAQHKRSEGDNFFRNVLANVPSGCAGRTSYTAAHRVYQHPPGYSVRPRHSRTFLPSLPCCIYLNPDLIRSFLILDPLT